jgi:hypothetical protein
MGFGHSWRHSQYDRTAEMLFAHLNTFCGSTDCGCAGPLGARDEFRLAATARNLRQLAGNFRELVSEPRSRRPDVRLARFIYELSDQPNLRAPCPEMVALYGPGTT